MQQLRSKTIDLRHRTIRRQTHNAKGKIGQFSRTWEILWISQPCIGKENYPCVSIPSILSDTNQRSTCHITCAIFKIRRFLSDDLKTQGEITRRIGLTKHYLPKRSYGATFTRTWRKPRKFRRNNTTKMRSNENSRVVIWFSFTTRRHPRVKTQNWLINGKGHIWSARWSDQRTPF